MIQSPTLARKEAGKSSCSVYKYLNITYEKKSDFSYLLHYMKKFEYLCVTS